MVVEWSRTGQSAFDRAVSGQGGRRIVRRHSVWYLGEAEQRKAQPSQANQGQPDQSQQSQTQPSQAQPNQAGQGQGTGNVTLTSEQRTRIQQTVLAGRNVPRVDNVTFALNVGVALPATVRIVDVPPTLIEIYPQWRGHQYFVVRDEIGGHPQ